MALYRLETKIINRQNRGRSVIPSAAYRSGSILHKAAYRSANILEHAVAKLTFNYQARAQEVVHSEILAPENGPSWLQTQAEEMADMSLQRDMRERLWNTIERVEKRKDSQLAREFIAALPKELNREQQIELVRGWCKAEFVNRGFVVDFAIHKSKNGKNPHAHILCTTRPVEKEGFGKKPSTAGKFNRRGVVGRQGKSELVAWRESWGVHANNALEKPITAISAPEILAMLRVIEGNGALDTAHRIMQMCGQIFMYAIATGRAERNPVPDLRGALKSPVARHHAYLKDADLPEFLQKLESYDGALQTKLALRLLLLTFVRTSELRAAEWTEINCDKAEWRIPAERMKMREQHIVPLSRQAIKALRELKKLTGHRQHVFPNLHNPVSFMSENTMLFAIYRMGYHSRTTGHGFRSTASTILNENGFLPDVIERQLAHGERNKVRAAYNHAQYLPERRKMMQWWADYLEGIAPKR